MLSGRWGKKYEHSPKTTVMRGVLCSVLQFSFFVRMKLEHCKIFLGKCTVSPTCMCVNGSHRNVAKGQATERKKEFCSKENSDVIANKINCVSNSRNCLLINSTQHFPNKCNATRGRASPLRFVFSIIRQSPAAKGVLNIFYLPYYKGLFNFQQHTNTAVVVQKSYASIGGRRRYSKGEFCHIYMLFSSGTQCFQDVFFSYS